MLCLPRNACADGQAADRASISRQLFTFDVDNNDAHVDVDVNDDGYDDDADAEADWRRAWNHQPL